MVEILGKLGVDHTIFHQFGIFIIFAFVIKKVLFEKLQSVIEQRSDQTQGLESKAASIMDEANKIKADVEQKIHTKKKSLTDDFREKKLTLELSLNENFKKSEVSAEEDFNKGLKDINLELSKVNENLLQQSDELSSLLTTKLTK